MILFLCGLQLCLSYLPALGVVFYQLLTEEVAFENGEGATPSAGKCRLA